MLVKKAGGLADLVPQWKGVGVLRAPKAANSEESARLAAAALNQRREEVVLKMEALYPKLLGQAVTWAVQAENDAYGSPVDMGLDPPEGTPMVPADITFLKSAKTYTN